METLRGAEETPLGKEPDGLMGSWRLHNARALAGLLTLVVLITGCPPDGDPPDPVGPIACRPKSEKVDVTWTLVEGATLYKILRAETGEPLVEAGEAKDPVFADFGLTNGTSYTYSVVAANKHGFAEPSPSCDVTPIDRGEPGSGPPVFSSTPLEEALEGHRYYYDAIAIDPDGTAVSYTLLEGPRGMVLNEDTGFVRWTPRDDQVEAYPVSILATDLAGETSTQDFDIAVAPFDRDPYVASQPERFGQVGEPYEYDVIGFDPDGDPVAYGFSEPPPSGMAIDPQTGLIEWTPPAAAAGTSLISVQVSDPAGNTGEQAYALQVLNDPLLIVSPAGAFQIDVGDTLELTAEANYPNARFSATPLVENAAFETTAYRFTPELGQEGVYSVLFRARLDEQVVGSLVTITVGSSNNAPPELGPLTDQTVSEGQRLLLPVVATDPDGDAVTLSAPGLGLDNAVFNEVSGQLQFNPSFDQAGVYPVTFRATDGALVDETTIDITVQDVAPPGVALELVVDPPASPTFGTTGAVTGNVVGAPGIPLTEGLPPFLTGLSPNAVRQGRSVEVTITGRDTQFADGEVAVSFGAGVHVDALEVLSPTSLRAQITAAEDAGLGVRSVTASGPSGSTYSVVAFSVDEGAAQISGTVIDPFTGQPLAGATIRVNGSSLTTTTDANGQFTLDGLDAGATQLIVALPNHELVRLDLAVTANQEIALDEPVGLNALARPPTPPGSLEPAATVASVIDRGLNAKDGVELSLEQAMALVEDTVLAIGGKELGLLDEAGNQLNPLVEDSYYLSMTPLHVELQARALLSGDVYTVRQFGQVLAAAFQWAGEFPGEAELVASIQAVVNEAWAQPADPQSAPVLVLFNEGTTLTAQPPLITPETRLNRFQEFFLTYVFLLAHAPTLELYANDILEANGIDPDTVSLGGLPTPAERFAALAADGMTDALEGALAWLGPRPAHAQAGPPTVPPNQEMDEEDSLEDRLMRLGRKVYSFKFLAEVGVGTFTSAIVQYGVKSAMSRLAGSAGGITGAVADTGIQSLLLSSFLTTIVTKLLILSAVEANIIGYEPAPIDGVNRVGFEDIGGKKRFVILFNKSPSENQVPGGSPVIQLLDFINTDNIHHTYHLIKFPDCETLDYRAPGVRLVTDADLKPVYDKDSNGKPIGQPRPNQLQFILDAGTGPDGTRWIDPGSPNFFRVATFQYYNEQSLGLNSARIKYGLKELGVTPPPPGTLSSAGSAALGQLRYGTPDAAAAQIRANYNQSLKEQFLVPIARHNAVYRQAKLELPQARAQSSDIFFRLDQIEAQLGDGRAALEQKSQIATLWKTKQLEGTTPIWNGNDTPAGIELRNILGVGPDDVDARTISSDLTLLTYAQFEIDDENFNIERLGRAQVDLSIAESQALTNPGTFELSSVDSNGIPDPKFYESIDATTVRDTATGQTLTFEQLRDVQENSLRLANDRKVRAEVELKGYADNIDQTLLRRAGLDDLVETLDTEALKAVEAQKISLAEESTALRKRLGDLERAGKELVESVPEASRKKAAWGNLIKFTESPGGRFFLPAVGVAFDLWDFHAQQKDRLSLLASPLSECFVVEGPDEDFPGVPIEIHPNLLVDGVVAAKRFNDPARNREGQLFLKYLFDSEPSTVPAGFPSEMIDTDDAGALYALNANSSFNYGGRIFKYIWGMSLNGDGDLVTGFAREFVGSVNYYSTQLQYGRPAHPIAMGIGDYSDEDGVTWEDLFVADIDNFTDFSNPRKRIMRVPIHLIKKFPGGYDSFQRNRVAGREWVHDERFRFTGPSDIEVEGEALDTQQPPRRMLMSDESQIFLMRQSLVGAGGVVRRIVDVPGRRWSGLAFDALDNFYFADQNTGEVWLMDEDTVDFLEIDTSFRITSEESLHANAFKIKEGLRSPRDIEIGRLERRLVVSSADEIEAFHLPIVGRYDPSDVAEVRLVVENKELPIHLRGVDVNGRVTFNVGLTWDHAFGREATLRIRRRNPDRWTRKEIRLSLVGATILEGDL